MRNLPIRARLLPLLGATFLCVGLGLVGGGCGGLPPPRNALVICIDTVRFDTFWLPETAGLPDAFSPWAERALSFDRTLAPSPWTLPSVASVFTGRYPVRHGAGYRDDPPLTAEAWSNAAPFPLPDGVPTLTSILAQRGYRIGGFAANPFATDRFGIGSGFALRIADARTLADQAARWLDDAPDPVQPWLLYLHWVDAHEHRLDRRVHRRKVAEGLGGLEAAARAAAPASICSGPASDRCLPYLAYVHDVLAQRRVLAELLSDLERRGALARTVVVLYSDHGEEFFDHAQAQRDRGIDRQAGLAHFGGGHGHSMYQELLHVPLLFWHPHEAGRRITAPVSLVDVLPTLLDWLAIDVAPSDSDWDGTSLARGAPEDRTLFASDKASGPAEYAVVQGRWKRIHRGDWTEPDLFDLGHDPAERQRVDDAALAQSLDDALHRHRSGAAPPAAARPELSAAEQRALQDLGYLDASPGGSR